MPKYHLADGQKNSLRWVIFGDVGRNLIDVKGLEVKPHRMRWVSQPAMRECICHQHIAEFVVYRGAWNGEDGQYGEPSHDRQDPDNRDRERPPLGEPAKTSLDA